MLTVIIPVKDEAKFLPNCLKSIAFADEILVLDSGSTDRSLEIARNAGARIVEYQWQGFRYSHELGAKEAQHEWLLYIDADERVSPKLSQLIQGAINSDQFNAYQVNRKNFIMGKALKHGGWYPDKVTRLIKKSALQKWIGELHEYPQIDGKIGYLNADLYHLTHRGLDWMLSKTQIYTKKSAQMLYQAGHPQVKVKNFFGASFREIWQRGIKHQGWKDGFIGWLEIFYQAFNAFLIQVYLWELQQGQSMEKRYEEIDEEIMSNV